MRVSVCVQPWLLPFVDLTPPTASARPAHYPLVLCPTTVPGAYVHTFTYTHTRIYMYNNLHIYVMPSKNVKDTDRINGYDLMIKL